MTREVLVIKFLIVSLIAAFGPLFSHGAGALEEGGETGRIKINKIAVIPFESQPGIEAIDPANPISRNEKYLTISFYDALVAQEPIPEIVPLQKSETLFSELKTSVAFSYYKDTALKVARELGADALVVGMISVYSEREGTELGVKDPASVAFSVELLGASDGQIIWETYFTETQKPLLDNVFEIKKFVKRGAKWITSDELALEGARKVAEELDKFLIENYADNTGH